MASNSDSQRLPLSARRSAARAPFFFVFILLLVEFLDEILFGVREAAWPLIRDDLRLSYTEIGVILSVPAILANFIEPVLAILADVWRRRAIILGGGIAFTLSALAVGFSDSFLFLLVVCVVFNPASGAFVGLSQAALMDAEPERREQNMARWTLAGSLGNAVGPLMLGAAVAYGVGWRALFIGMAGLSLLVLALAWRLPFPTPAATEDEGASFRKSAREAARALKRREVWRWLVLLRCGDLTADVLYGFLALYFVDVVGASEAQGALAVVVWTCVGLPGDVLLLPVLERVNGLRYLRWSTACVLLLFPAMLLAPTLWAKLALLGALGLANAGWYSILKAQLYAEFPRRSGTALALGNVFGLVGDLLPLALGMFAQRHGLGAMMWLLLLGPAALLLGLLTAPAKRA